MFDKRIHKRFPFRWPVALVFDEHHGQHQAIYHGTTRELSLGGCSLLTDYNIYSSHPMTLLISLPAESALGKRQVLEVRCRMTYTILAAGHDRFRCGIEFISFKGDGRYLFQQAIEQRIPGGTT